MTVEYCTVQDVRDELDGKTSDDISDARITSNIERSQGMIDLRTGTSFEVRTETDEVHEVNRYNIESSPDFLDTNNNGSPIRVDSFTSGTLNRVYLKRTPVIAISALSKNGAATNATDDWTALTEQTGSGGSYVLAEANVGSIDFLSSFPRFGKRSWRATYTWGYDPTSTDAVDVAVIQVVERLTVLLAVQQIITAKSSSSMFDSTNNIRIGTIELQAGGASTRNYLGSIQIQILELWKNLGDLGFEIV